MTIKEKVNIKNNLIDTLANVISNSAFSFLEHCKGFSTKEFQRALKKVPFWEPETKQKYFDKFYGTAGIALSEIVSINASILASIKCDVSFESPEEIDFWFECLKSISKEAYYKAMKKETVSEESCKSVVKKLIENVCCSVKVNYDSQDDISFSFNNVSREDVPSVPRGTLSDSFDSKDIENEYYDPVFPEKVVRI